MDRYSAGLCLAVGVAVLAIIILINSIPSTEYISGNKLTAKEFLLLEHGIIVKNVNKANFVYPNVNVYYGKLNPTIYSDLCDDEFFVWQTGRVPDEITFLFYKTRKDCEKRKKI